MYNDLTTPLTDITTDSAQLQNASFCDLVMIAEGMVPSDPVTRSEARRIFNDIKQPDQLGYGCDEEEELFLNIEKQQQL